MEIVDIAVNNLVPYDKNPRRLYKDTDLNTFAGSANGKPLHSAPPSKERKKQLKS